MKKSTQTKLQRTIKELRLAHGWLFIAFLGLLALGTNNVFSSTFVINSEDGSLFEYLTRHVVAALLGLIGGAILYFRPYQSLRRIVIPVVAIVFVLLLAVKFVGVEVNGAKRWIVILGFQFQPSEFAKLTVILYMAKALADTMRRKEVLEFFPYQTLWQDRPWYWRLGGVITPYPPLWIPAILAGLVILQPDAGTAIVIMGIPLMMMVIGGAHLKKIAVHSIIGGTVFMYYLLSAPYRMDRIKAWWDPESYASNLGYQVKQSMIAIGSGGLTGQGVGEGVSKFRYLPEAHTDFAFAIVAQEGGFIVAAVVLLTFFLIAYYGIVTARSCRHPFGTFTALGITIYFCGQGLINIAMVCDVIPVVGVPLPFISYGGTSLIVNLMAAGILLNIARTNLREALAERNAALQQQQEALAWKGVP